MRVFLTVDTEVWPRRPGWPRRPLEADDRCERQLQAYFWGGDREPRQGLPFMLETLARHELRATFFVDPLFSVALGRERLREVVAAIEGARQEVGLHLHPEWLTDARAEGLPSFKGPLLHQYPLDEQAQLINTGLQLLEEAGASQVVAFRAGSWGADTTTIQALQSAGIAIDSSLNACFPASFPSVRERRGRLDVHKRGGVWEFPATYFRDARSLRPVQLCACSFGELRYVLEECAADGPTDLVLVTHSFEMVRVGDLDAGDRAVRPRRWLGRRFMKFCQYLGQHRDRFQTAHFRSIDPSSGLTAHEAAPVASSWLLTLLRHAEQALSEVY